MTACPQGKVAYVEESQARAALFAVRRRHKGRKGDTFHPRPEQSAYHCPHCRQWHLGSVKGWLPKLHVAERESLESARRASRNGVLQ